jgi:P4 family phage/plasmid primase-like protien
MATNRSKKLGLSLNGNGNGNGVEYKKPRLVKPNSKKGTLEQYADSLLKDIGLVMCVGTVWYNYGQGVWKEVSPDSYLPKAWKVQNTKSDRGSKAILEAIRQQKQVSQNQLRGAIRAEDGYWLVNCANCVLRVTGDGETISLAHSPDYMFTLQIASRFDSISTCPNFMKTLREVLPAQENRELNLDFASSALLPDSRFQCMLFCTGSGGNGKSTVWEAIANALGKDVVSRVSYHDLCENNRKYVWRLERKLLNLGTETIAKPIGENAVVKAMTCGEEFDTDRMYGESFPMKTSCKLAFLTNHSISYESGSNAEIRRTRMIHYGETFEGAQIDRTLESKLANEGDGIFTMLITRLKRVVSLDEMSYGDAVSRDAYNQFRGRNDLVLAFIKDCLVRGEFDDEYIPKQDLWSVYKKFASRFNSLRWSQEAFFRRLYEIRPDIHQAESRRRVEGKLTYLVLGLGFTKLGQGIMNEVSEGRNKVEQR